MASDSVRFFSSSPAPSTATILYSGLTAAFRFLLALAAAFFPNVVAWAAAMPPAADKGTYVDVLDMHGAPKSAKDRSFNIFFDAGAWHGYSLPLAPDRDGGFVGPFVHSFGEGQWIGRSFAALSLQDASGHRPFPPARIEDHAFPGYLVRRFSSAGVQASETLFFADSGRTLVRIDLTSDKNRDIDLRIDNSLWTSSQLEIDEPNDTIVQRLPNSNSKLITMLHIDGGPAVQLSTTATGYRFATKHPLRLEANKTRTVYLDQVFIYDTRSEIAPAVDYAQAWQKNRERWSGYLKNVDASRLAGVPDETARRIAVKSILTLLGNWRAARGDLHHDGVIPSYSNPDFNGFWAWDSWKHAAALARFAPALAREQMRAMFDYQADDGMVPDCVFLDKANDNWRDTKPPLAAWAVREIYRATDDKAFLGEMYPKLVRYHRWWFAKRDHDHNGLAEYGSTDGTQVAAKWESGMDNGARFDAIAMLKNGDGAWSMDQESADLNAYLYLEKLELAEIADALGKAQDGEQWTREAAAMKAAIRKRMFDPARGYFFDVKLGRDEFVPVYGSEGWTALWAGVATPEQAQAVTRAMLDPKKFSTRFPFPTLAADDPRFSPVKGYWRGPVWIDQAWFGVEALKRYGFDRQADDIAKQLVLNAKGLTGQAPMYENYDPLTGEGHQSRNFSWAAASYWFLVRH